MVALLDASVAVVIEASEKGAAGSRGDTHACVGNGVKISGGGWQTTASLSGGRLCETADSLGKTGTIQLRTNYEPIQPSNLGQSQAVPAHACVSGKGLAPVRCVKAEDTLLVVGTPWGC